VTEHSRFVRRNRVDERSAFAIAAAAGVIAAFAGAQPTGNSVVDIVLVVSSVGAVVWASASAPWWAPTVAVGVGATIAIDPIVAAVAALGFVGGLLIGLRQRDLSTPRAVVAAIAMNVLIRSELGGFLGLSAIIGVTLGVLLFVSGLRRRPSRVQRRGWIATAWAGGLATVALVSLGVAGFAARPDLSRGTREANAAIELLNSGDYQAAAARFSDASTSFRSAENKLAGPLAMPSRLIPGVAQNVTAGAELAVAAGEGTAEAAAALRAIDPASLSVVDGAIDLEAVAAVEGPLLQVERVLADLDSVSADIESPWLLAPVQDELVELEDRLDANRPRLRNAIDAVRLVPQMLGDDGRRRYLVLFTTPSELRGIAGFIGNYADITVMDGRIEIDEFGRRSDLEDVISEEGASCPDLPEDLMARYGRFGLTNGPEGGANPRVWSNLTMPAHFPYVAEAAACLYPQSGGSPIDGVIAIDPYVVEALMKYTGPIEVPELGVTVTPDNAARFILEDQYVLAGDDTQPDRVDALQTLGQEVIARLLAGSLPEPSQLARDLGPLASEHRLMVWTDDPEERAMLASVEMLGALPQLGPEGGFSVVATNAGESKIDVFLERETALRVETDPAGGQRLIADVMLTNMAPPAGLPDYVIGNSVGLPNGSSNLNVTFYGPPSLEAARENGEETVLAPLAEAGWIAYGTEVVLGPGESVRYRLEFALPPDADADTSPIEWVQPLAGRPA
jgi:hypothetical protein